ncbi:AAA family ATPase [Muricauda sp. SCSIO 64092]|uniref:AAA family ATPase n=1 Tax=Allomuricauda sp. SCSIO 64092 TaxID=2908842 RepID=UPI001FF5CEDD|nr:ATP-binding protein [Muricauda sp. SCSIO 64092]UOY06573.1 AAA family ATPase [Muricauda sp. SCSIO 64092]
MIQSLTIRNYRSFKNEVTFSFEATREKTMEDIHVVEVVPGVRLLKMGVIYGPNASGKSNLISAFQFIKYIWSSNTDSKDDEVGVEPFLLDNESKNDPSFFRLIFYHNKKKYDYSLFVNNELIINEKLSFYPSTQPKLIFERTHREISEIEFGAGLKLKMAEKNEIIAKCLPNMSVFAAYNQVNLNLPEIESVLKWMNLRCMDTIEPDMHVSLGRYVEELINSDDEAKLEVLNYLKEADFNISDIHSEIVKEDIPEFFIANILEDSGLPQKEKERIRKEKTFDMPRTEFEHEVQGEDGNLMYFKMSKGKQSEGTIRTFELAGPITQTIKRNAFLAIDEIESKLHPRLIEFIIEDFLRKSNESQLLVTTHYDGLLDEEDLLRVDNVWFTEKSKSASTNLYSLANFKALKRISSLLKAYKYGRFGAIPNIG